MDLERLVLLTEELRRQAIGDPKWVTEKQVYEYEEQSIRIVVILKAIRAFQGVQSARLLCNAGLFVDMGAIIRCVYESVSGIYFLLENFHDVSQHVDRFLKGFFEKTIDGWVSSETDSVKSAKIHSAMVRVLSNGERNEVIRQNILNIFKAFSGYIHANYAHIMEMFGGREQDFHMNGVPSIDERQRKLAIVEAMALSVRDAVAFIAGTLNFHDLYREIMEIAD